LFVSIGIYSAGWMCLVTALYLATTAERFALHD